MKFMKSRLFKSISAAIMACALLVTGLPAFTPTTTEAEPEAVPKVFFDASKSGITFNPDVYNAKIGKVTDYDLTLQSSTDAAIVENGVLRVDYDAIDVSKNNITTNGKKDGSYTIVGIGGGSNVEDCKTVTFTMKTTDPDIAKYMNVRFFNLGNEVLKNDFDTWMTEANIDTTIPADGEWHDITLPVPFGAKDVLKGMKITFDRADKAGTVWFKPIVFTQYNKNQYVFDEFSNRESDKINPLTVEGVLPLVRTPESINGAIAGHNISKNQMWTMSTSAVNIVDNSLSGGKALQIQYQKTTATTTYARLKATEVVQDESLMAITLKGEDLSGEELYGGINTKVDDILNVVLLNDGEVTATIPFSEFYEEDKLLSESHTNMNSSEYTTYYTTACAGKVFDTIAFEISGSGEYAGRIYVKEISFPRYSYKVNHYFDNEFHSTDIVSNAKYNDEMTLNKIEDNVYKYERAESSTAIKRGEKYYVSTVNEDNIVNMYYVSEIPYTVEYYKGTGDKAEKFDTVSGIGTIGDSVAYDNTKKPVGYKFDSTDKTKDQLILSVGGENVLRVYYVKDEFPYVINYFYDNKKDEKNTVTGKALYESYILYESKNKPGYKEIKVDPTSGSIQIDVDKEVPEKNIINVYYEKQKYKYTVEYYYEGELDSDNTETSEALYGSSVGYADKSKDGYELDSAATGEGKITISDNEAKNIIKVYYKKANFEYRVEYYYDGERDSSKTETGTSVFESQVGYTDKIKTGYAFVGTDPASGKLIITSDKEKNVLKVYYAKDTFPYTVEYYYEGKLDDTKTVKASAQYGSEVGYEDKNITGYKFDKVTPESGNITIDEKDNVIKVYYVKDEFPYTVKYYYDGKLDESKTETGKALFESEVNYEDKVIDGYELDYATPNKGNIKISEKEENNVIEVYYKKANFEYTVEYYYDNKKDDSKTVTKTAEFGSEVGYTDLPREGYKLTNTEPAGGTIKITSDKDKNIIKVYYDKDEFPYTVEYYYDGKLDPEKTVTKSAKFESEVQYEDKNIPGYKLDKLIPAEGKIQIKTSDNVIKVYYVKDEFEYTVKYYYDGKLDDSKTVIGKELFGNKVDYEDKVIDGYKLDYVTPESGKITISEKEKENVIEVYYKKANFDYTVEYYYDNVKESTVSGNAEFDSEVGFEKAPKKGYAFVGTDPATGKIKITSDKEKNVLKVYYAKDTFPYTVEYYYDGKLDDTKTVIATAVFEDEIKYEDKNITGYKLDYTTPESGKITIDAEEGGAIENNIIKVYYVKDEFPYTVKYYYDGEINESKTETGKAVFESEVNYEDKVIDGYELDYATPNEGKLKISANADENVIEVYYKKANFDYTVEYYYNDVKDDSKTVTGTAVFASEVEYAQMPKEGYVFTKTDPENGKLKITSDKDKNVLKVYYDKDEFPYAIKYYYDGNIDDTKTETGKAVFESEITYEDKVIDGYELDYVTPVDGKISIAAVENGNIIEVYYKKAKFDYTVEYYIDGKLDDTKKGTGEFGANIPYDKEKKGYTFVEAKGDAIITSNSENNVVKVYFKSIPKKVVSVPAPKTGDIINPFVLAGALLIAIMLLVTFVIRRKRLS